HWRRPGQQEHLNLKWEQRVGELDSGSEMRTGMRNDVGRIDDIDDGVLGVGVAPEVRQHRLDRDRVERHGGTMISRGLKLGDRPPERMSGIGQVFPGNPEIDRDGKECPSVTKLSTRHAAGSQRPRCTPVARIGDLGPSRREHVLPSAQVPKYRTVVAAVTRTLERPTIGPKDWRPAGRKCRAATAIYVSAQTSILLVCSHEFFPRCVWRTSCEKV